MDNGCIYVEIKKEHSDIEICCSSEMKDKVSKLLVDLLSKDGNPVIEVPKKFSLPPLLEAFYPHSRERADSIINAMNRNRTLLINRFSDDLNFQDCPEGFLFFYVNNLVDKMNDPINPPSIEQTIKRHFMDGSH